MKNQFKTDLECLLKEFGPFLLGSIEKPLMLLEQVKMVDMIFFFVLNLNFIYLYL